MQFLVEKYIKSGYVVGIGTSKHAEKFLKKIAEKMHYDGLKVKMVPTSTRMAGIIALLGIPISSISEKEVDVAIEFVSQVDKGFNFIKRNSYSLVRDKMIAQSSAEMIALAEKKDFVERLHGTIPFEISTFAWRRTLIQLENFGDASLRMQGNKPFKTETGHYIVDVDVADIFSLDDLEYQTKEIPGVLETGLFIGYADRIVLMDGKKITVKSRIRHPLRQRLRRTKKGSRKK